MSLKCPSCPSNVRFSHCFPWECDNWSTWLVKHEKLAGVVRISVGAFLAPGQKICPSGVPRVPHMSLVSLKCPSNVTLSHCLPWKCDNWTTLLTKHERSAGVVRISAGALLAPGQNICPSSVPCVPQVSLKQY